MKEDHIYRVILTLRMIINSAQIICRTNNQKTFLNMVVFSSYKTYNRINKNKGGEKMKEGLKEIFTIISLATASVASISVAVKNFYEVRKDKKKNKKKSPKKRK
ncbi:hypothetical protein CN555_06145 [Bacillus wiedmannii]|nr:hypothetical protein CN555_06145 [Bacillus wiedmannii]